jgi:hypothetical protein
MTHFPIATMKMKRRQRNRPGRLSKLNKHCVRRLISILGNGKIAENYHGQKLAMKSD